MLLSTIIVDQDCNNLYIFCLCIGIQRRLVTCHSSDGQAAPDALCDPYSRPADTTACNNGPCTSRSVLFIKSDIYTLLSIQ